MQIPFVSFDKTNNTIRSEVLKSFEHFFDKQSYVLGEEVKKFERAYANFNNVTECIGVSNGLDALHIALKTLEIKEGDEVILPSNTYIATVLAISYTGAKPIFVEPNINTYNLDINKIEDAITPKTKCIMPVHLYGQACEMDDIMHISEKYKLNVVEDNAQAQGASYKGKMTGSFGIINATSFYPGKNLGALGDAGAVTTNDTLLAEKASILRNYGSAKKYSNEVIGFNMRLDEFQATMLNIKLAYLNDWSKERQQIAKWYHEELKEVDEIILPHIASNSTSVYHLFVIRVKKREALQKYLNNRGISTLIHYPIPPHLQKAYQHLGYKKGDFPIAESLADSCLSLPMYIGLSKEEIHFIVKTIKEFIVNCF